MQSNALVPTYISGRHLCRDPFPLGDPTVPHWLMKAPLPMTTC